MGVTKYVNMIVQHIQFMALLAYLQVEWPKMWQDVLDFITLLNLDPQDILGEQELPIIDFRMLFIIVCIILPLLINLMILLLFRTMIVIIWYALLVFGTVVFAAGLAAMLLPSSGLDATEDTAKTYMILGGCIIFAMGFIFALRLVWKHFQVEEDLGLRVAHQREVQNYHSKFHRRKAFAQFALAALLLIVGLLLTGLLRSSTRVVQDAGSALGGLLLIVGWGALVLGAMLAIYFMVHLFKCGRDAVNVIRIFLRTNLLLFLLIIISLSYIPIVTYCLSMFMCANYECPAGSLFHPYAFRPSNSYDTSSDRFCDKCEFLNPPCGPGNATNLCPAFKQRRLWQSPDVPCDDSATIFFQIAAGIVVVIYATAIPFLYYRIIKMLTTRIAEKVVANKSFAEDPQKHWPFQMMKCSTAAGTLYESFHINHKYYTLVTILHRLVIVTVLVVVAPFWTGAPAVVLLVHGAACCIFMIFRPYVDELESSVAGCLAVCNVLNSVFAVWVWVKEGEVPAYVTGIFILLNVVIPTLAAIFVGIRRLSKGNAEDKSPEECRLWAAGVNVGDAIKIMWRFPNEKVPQDPWLGKVVGKKESPLKSGKYRLKVVYPQQGDVILDFPPKETDVIMVFHEVSHEPIEEVSVECDVLAKTITETFRGQVHAQQDIDDFRQILNNKTADMLSQFFMILGFFLFLALGIAILGTLRQKPVSDVIATNPVSRGVYYVLGNYESWDEFTSSCCCLNSHNPSVRFNLTERWACANGKIVEKGRVSRDYDDNSLPFRSVCSVTLNQTLPSCQIMVVNGIAKLACGDVDKGKLVPRPVSHWAYNYYW